MLAQTRNASSNWGNPWMLDGFRSLSYNWYSNVLKVNRLKKSS